MTALAVGFATPLGLLAGVCLVPILALFLLKRRYQDRPVGSTLLWARALEDVLARAPFRRPMEWLSLVLLLVAATALALAAGGMRVGVDGRDARRVVLVLDVSASMTTEDAEDGRSRFERARDKADELIAGLSSDSSAAIVAAGPSPRVIGHESDDPAALRTTLSRLEPAMTEASLGDAFELAERLVKGGEASEVIVFSDFAVPPDELQVVAASEVPVTLVDCGEEVANAGIVHVAVSGHADGARLLVMVAGRGGPALRTLVIERDDALVDARDVTVPAGGEVALVFDVGLAEGRETARYAARLEPRDAFPGDDVAHVGVARGEPPRLLVIGEETRFLTQLEHVFPGLELTRVGAAEASAIDAGAKHTYDAAIVTERLEGEGRIPARRVLYMGEAPKHVGVGVGLAIDDPAVLSWERGDDDLRGVGFENLLLVRAHELRVPAGGRVLLSTTAGPQLVVIETPDQEAFVWASALADSNWVLLPAFPIFVRNLLGRSLFAIQGHALRAAEAPRITAGLDRLTGTVELSITSPGGATRELEAWAREDLPWPRPAPIGFHEVRARAKGTAAVDAMTRDVGVSLLSRAETTLPSRPPDDDRFPPAAVRLASVGSFDVERPIWRTLVLTAIALLAAESLLWSGAIGRRRVA